MDHCLAQIFGIYVVAAIPLLFQGFAFVGELLRDPFDHVGDERVGTFDRFSGLVNERGLDLVPTGAEVVQFVIWKERAGTSWSAGARRNRDRSGVGGCPRNGSRRDRSRDGRRLRWPRDTEARGSARARILGLNFTTLRMSRSWRCICRDLVVRK